MKDLFTNAVNQTLAKIAVLCLTFAFSAVAEHNQDSPKQHVVAQSQGIKPDNLAFMHTLLSAHLCNAKTEQRIAHSPERMEATGGR